MARIRALGYVRVSTTEQLKGLGLDIQEEGIRDYAKANDLRLVEVHRDEGESGSNGLESRTGLAQALARLEDGEASVLVVYRLDRLARDLVLQETIIGRLGRTGAQVTSISEPDLGVGDADPTRTLVRHLLGAISQYEGAVIRARLVAGRAAKRARGGYAGGRPAFGYRAESAELVPDAREQEAIQQARRLRGKGHSLREVANELAKRGYKPKARGAVWHPTQVARLLASTS